MSALVGDPYPLVRSPWTPPAMADAVTTELPPALPRNLPVKIRTLLYVHARVTSRRWLLQRASQDGTVHHLADGPVMRVRTADLTPVPALERTPR